MFFTKKTQQWLAAAGLALGIVALGACSGGGGSSIPSPATQPNQPPGPNGLYSAPLSAAGMSVNLPGVAGFSETLTVPSNNAAAGTNLTVRVTQSAPLAMPRLDPNMHVAIPFLYFMIGTNKDVKLNGFPGFKMTIPAGFNMGNLPVKVGYYDPIAGWKHIGDFVMVGHTVTFAPTSAAVTLKANVVYYAITYTCGGGSPTPSPTPTGVISCTASGTGAIGVLCETGGSTAKTFAFVGEGRKGSASVEQVDISGGASGGGSGHITHTYSSTTSTYYTNCAGDEKHLRVFCGAYSSGELMDINASPLTDAEFSTGASGSLTFTGGSCTICAIAFDPIDTAFILEDPNPTAGGGQFQRVGESSHTIDSTITTPDPNENPGYDYVKNWVWNPQYGGGHLEIADFGSGKLYTTSGTISSLSTPDSGGVDVSTHIAETPNEFDFVNTIATLGTATLSGSTLSGVSTGSTTFTSNAFDSALDIDASEVDSVLHLTFYVGEFGTNTLGFGLLPTTSTGTTFSDWAFVKWPAAPDGSAFTSGVDPHQVAVFNDPVNCPDCALALNANSSWLAVVDLDKLMHAPRSVSDTHSIDSSYNLVTNHVVAFYQL